MSVAESGHDAWRLLFRVYDHHQPLARADIPLEEALAQRSWVRLTMIGVGKDGEHDGEIGLELGMPLLRSRMWRRRCPRLRFTQIATKIATTGSGEGFDGRLAEEQLRRLRAGFS